MTRFEVKEEIKETEGDPLIRAKRKKLQRELTTEGMVEALRKADVVISGQKKIAIAIQYKKGESNAPVVLAKGKELMADQLRLLAKEFKVPVKRDLSLANSLFKIELNKEIPETLFEDVARVLKWVYQMKKR
jgi:flagellar biosynthesis protein FlhB